MAEPHQVEASVQLLVEGNDQLNFFETLVSRLEIDGIQIQNFGGVNELTLFLETLASTREFKDEVKSVGIIRDAEASAQSAFQSVQGSLHRADLPIPDQPGQSACGSPAVSMLILPGDDSPGMLETLLCRTFVDTPMNECIESFFQCAQDLPNIDMRRPDKARAHAYIATLPDPHVSVGVAAQRSYWNLDHAALGSVRNFLRSL